MKKLLKKKKFNKKNLRAYELIKGQIIMLSANDWMNCNEKRYKKKILFIEKMWLNDIFTLIFK